MFNYWIGKVDVYEMPGFAESKQKTLISSFTDSDTVNVFVEAFKNAVKRTGNRRHD